MALPDIGTRINLNNHLGTVKFVGHVDRTPGVWLGIEWDNPDRGKHDGSKDGKQYFACRINGAGSFIRQTANIIYGVSFLDGLRSKYIEALHGPNSQEKIILGSSNGTIEVEAVSLDKIRERFGHLDRLREVSLDNENIVRADPPGEILKTCPNTRGLDLSMNLISTWETVAQITRELLLLQSLALNRNRFQTPTSYESLTGAFSRLTELQLNSTLMTWLEMQSICVFMPKLQVLEMGYNRLTDLKGDRSLAYNSVIQNINLDGNACTDWENICGSLGEYKSLERVILTSNQIEAIPFPTNSQVPLSSLKYLSLSRNRIRTWTCVDALSCWFPSLTNLTMSDNPLISESLGQHTRPFLIARIPSLVTLDGASISSKERWDSELFYMSRIMQEPGLNEAERRKAHYQWQALCKKHGVPDNDQAQFKSQDKLSNRLIELTLKDSSESTLELDRPEQNSLRVLPTMTLRNLRVKICKVLKCNARTTEVICQLRMRDDTLSELEHEYDSREIDWLGIENGSQIVYTIRPL